ncbi:MAG: hypothetical protein LBT37_04135 [Lactobacillaceae bacterium]|nr:hypothetical protein [Lactobacillaceae bacterium]
MLGASLAGASLAGASLLGASLAGASGAGNPLPISMACPKIRVLNLSTVKSSVPSTPSAYAKPCAFCIAENVNESVEFCV